MIKQAEFCAALKIVLHSSAGEKELRGHLQSVLFRFYTSHKLKLVSTNGHVISIVDIQTGSGLHEDLDFLVCREDVEELLSLFKVKSDKEVSINVGGDTICFSNGQDTRSFSPLEGAFPDYECVMPTGGTPAPKVRFSSTFIEKALKSCKDVTAGKNGAFNIELQDDKCVAYFNPVLKEELVNIQSVTIGIMPQRQ